MTIIMLHFGIFIFLNSTGFMDLRERINKVFWQNMQYKLKRYRRESTIPADFYGRC